MTRNARPAAELGPRQERFVEEYLIDVNAKQAAIRAGYSPKTAEVQGSRLLRNVKVQRVMAARITDRSKRTEVAGDRVLLEIARLGFSDLRRLFREDGRLKHPDEWDDDTAASVAPVEVVARSLGDGEVEYVRKIKLWDKGKALEQLSKHLGLYRDQGPSEQPGDRPLSDLRDEELYQRLFDARARLNRAIEHEQGIRCRTKLTGDGPSGLLGIGGPRGDDLTLAQPLNRGRTAQPYALAAGAVETGTLPGGAASDGEC